MSHHHDFAQRFASPGIFNYHDTGFEVELPSRRRKCEWSDITKMLAYKVDLITVDEIVVEVYLANGEMFLLSEETDGYYQFVARSKIALPEIPPDWDSRIIQPPFQRNETILLQRH